jgi:hypothetical protein
MQNVEPHIYCDGDENILNNIVRCSILLTMGAMKKVVLARFKG